MSSRLISQQMLFEHEVVARLSDALRTAVAWNQHGDLSRKLASIQFLSHSFQRHVERMFELEEHAGYMGHVETDYPQFAQQIAAFRSQHADFRRQITGWSDRLNEADSLTSAEADALFESMLELLNDIDDHNKQEMVLLEEIIVNQTASD